MSIETIVFLAALAPVLIFAVLGWKWGATWEIRRFFVLLIGGLVAMRYCYDVTAYAMGFASVDPRLLGAALFLLLFALGAGVTAAVVNLRGDFHHSLEVNWLDNLLGALLGLLSGAVVGGAVLVVASLALPPFVAAFDASRLPLDAGKLPLAAFEKAEAAITALPPAGLTLSQAPGTNPLPESIKAEIAANAPTPTPSPTPPPYPKAKYQRLSYDSALARARQNLTSNLSLNSAFRLGQLDQAKQKAQREGKLMGFIMVWDQFFNQPDSPLGKGSNSALAHFYQVFNDNLILVFVRHEDELGKVPDSVAKGFRGPDEGGFAPNMAVVSADAQDYICEIPYGGNDSNGQIREQIYRDKINTINTWLNTPFPAATPSP